MLLLQRVVVMCCWPARLQLVVLRKLGFKMVTEWKAGLSLRGGVRGLSLATMNVAPSYFHSKIDEK